MYTMFLFYEIFYSAQIKLNNTNILTHNIVFWQSSQDNCSWGKMGNLLLALQTGTPNQYMQTIGVTHIDINSW